MPICPASRALRTQLFPLLAAFIAALSTPCLARAAVPGPRPRAAAPRADSFEAAYRRWSRSYRRSLLAMKKGRGEKTKLPLESSRAAWYELLDRYLATPPPEFAEDPQWHTDLATITGCLHLGEWLVYAGDRDRAHEALEPVRHIWLRIRERNGVRWFGDELTRYHDVMEPVVLWGTGETHGGVTPENVGEFGDEVAALARAWRKVKDFGYRPMARRDLRRFPRFMAREVTALSSLQAAVAARQYDQMAEASLEVRNAFLPIFIWFD